MGGGCWVVEVRQELDNSRGQAVKPLIIAVMKCKPRSLNLPHPNIFTLHHNSTVNNLLHFFYSYLWVG